MSNTAPPALRCLHRRAGRQRPVAACLPRPSRSTRPRRQSASARPSAAFDGVVEARAPDRDRGAGVGRRRAAGRQGRRPRAAPARCCCASTPARPTRRPRPATRRCSAARAALDVAAKEFERQQQLFAEAIHQPGGARPRRIASSRPPRRRSPRNWRRPAPRARRPACTSCRRPMPAWWPRCRWRWATWRCPAGALVELYDPAALRVTAAVPQSVGRVVDAGRVAARRAARPARSAQRWLDADAGAAAADGRRRPRTRCSCAPTCRPASRRRAGHVRAALAAAARPAATPALWVPAQAVVRRAEMTGALRARRQGPAAAAPGAPGPQRRRAASRSWPA